METTNEKERIAFSRRLGAEVSRIGLPVDSPTKIAHAFNQQFAGQPVTAQTVRKWLLAEAIPRQPKLLALAALLGVSAQWLRFGTGSRLDKARGSVSSKGQSGLLVLGDKQAKLIPLVEQIALLAPRDIRVVEGLVSLLLQQSKRDRA